MKQIFLAILAMAALAACSENVSTLASVEASADAQVDGTTLDSTPQVGVECSDNLVCNDGNDCTTDKCIDSSCVAVLDTDGQQCDDNNPCLNLGICKTGVCMGWNSELWEWPCDDGDACTWDRCIPFYDEVCVHSTFSCTDDIPQTLDWCDKGVGCMHSLPDCVTATDCDDGNPCTWNKCTDGSCSATNIVAEDLVECNDGNPCTNFSMCDEGICMGYNVFMGAGPIPCDDGNSCTYDECNPVKGPNCQHRLLSCDDGNQCTVDWCDKELGCQHTANNGGACDDHNGCTEQDTCKGDKCEGTLPPYSYKFVGEGAPFSCAPCEDEGDCVFSNQVFCNSSYGPSSYGPITYKKPTGKCVKNKCEFVEELCSDGDINTWHSCIGYGSIYPNIQAGKCTAETFSDTTYDSKNIECWCTTETHIKCVSYVYSLGKVTDQKVTIDKECAGTCGPDCLK